MLKHDGTHFQQEDENNCCTYAIYCGLALQVAKVKECVSWFFAFLATHIHFYVLDVRGNEEIKTTVQRCDGGVELSLPRGRERDYLLQARGSPCESTVSFAVRSQLDIVHILYNVCEPLIISYNLFTYAFES